MLGRAHVGVVAWAVALGAWLLTGGCKIDDRPLGVRTHVPDATIAQLCGAACPEVLCPADDACRDYLDLLPRGSCGVEAESCASVADCSFVWKAGAREGAACACGPEGCKLLAGEACERPGVCESGSCVATDTGGNVCCAATCAASEVCAPDGSGCVAATPCSEGQLRCSGAVHQQCTAGVWETLTDCAELGCSNERGGCLRSAGQACETGAECGVGACLPTAEGTRVCCTAACDTSCRRCAASGDACEDIADDDACSAIACPTGDVCRTYDPPSVTTNRCVEGRCATPAEACTVFTPARADLECSPSSLCDDQGNCSRPKKPLLEPCGSASECGSGACVATLAGDSVCCAAACAANEICNVAGACEAAPVCENEATQCSGSDFRRCTDGQWRTVRECGAVGCSAALGGCLGGAGDACGSEADCGVGSCQPTSSGGSVCCTAACDGACRRCDPSGAACENLEDDAACGTIACPADSTCRDFPGSVSTNRCVDGRCGSAGQLCTGTPRAAGQSCSASNLCDNAGNCNVPKKAVGAACGSSAECALGNCIEGVCCNSGCGGICSTCAGTGICRAPAADSRCSTGLCSSPGVCQLPSVTCGTETCIIGEDICCSELSAAGDSRLLCERGADACPPPPAFVPDVPITCDQHLDCPSDRVCCLSGTSTSSEISCKLPNPSPDTDELSIDFESCAPLNPMLFGYQLCVSPQGTFQCPAFEDCEYTNSRLPGYTFCQ